MEHADVILLQLYRADASIHTIPITAPPDEKVMPRIYMWYDPKDGLLTYGTQHPCEGEDADDDVNPEAVGVFRFLRKLQGFWLYEEVDDIEAPIEG
jgi:hypothetical protein